MAYQALGTHNDKDLDEALQRQIAAYGRAYEDAKAVGNSQGMKDAHSAAEAIRDQYGYSGGVDGSDYLAKPQAQTQAQPQQQTQTMPDYASQFQTMLDQMLEVMGSSQPESYTSQYSSQIDSMLNQILNRDGFSYDHTTDPLYAQYASAYQREGQRSMQDTLGAVAGSTGGLASSYATTAAQQAGDYYAAKQADIIPELYQLAYSMYLDDIDGQVRDLGLLNDMDSTQYGRYRDTMSDWRNDLDFAYGAFRDSVGDARYQNEWDYKVGQDERSWDYQTGRDSLEDARYQDETAYNRYQDALSWAYQRDSDAYKRAMERWNTLGTADESVANALGVPVGTTTSDYQYQLAQQTQMAAKSGSSGSSGGTGGSKSGSSGIGADSGYDSYESLFQAMYDAGVTTSAEAQNWMSRNSVDAKSYGNTAATVGTEYAAWAANMGKTNADSMWEGINRDSVKKAAGQQGKDDFTFEELEALLDSGKLAMIEKNGELYVYWASEARGEMH